MWIISSVLLLFTLYQTNTARMSPSVIVCCKSVHLQYFPAGLVLRGISTVCLSYQTQYLFLPLIIICFSSNFIRLQLYIIQFHMSQTLQYKYTRALKQFVRLYVVYSTLIKFFKTTETNYK